MKQNGRCALTGTILKHHKLNKKHHSTYDKSVTASLDRIDSSKGYIINNIQWVHKNINKMKNKLSNNEFIQMCQDVSEYNKEK